MSAAPERTICRTCGRTFNAGERFCPNDGSDLQPDRPATPGDPLMGTVISGSYTLLSKLGGGGMGVVYRARQHRLQRDVALKVLSSRLGEDKSAEDRFRTEALAISQLSDPHTVAIHDFGSTGDGLLYIVMQLIDGESLRARLGRGPLPVRSAASIAAQVCESLAEAHDRRPQIIHRDIKPDNILVRRTPDGDDFAVVLDFGLAKLADGDRLTATGLIVGTPAYMAPEQARAERLDHRVDIYALGIVLYEMLAGIPPFMGPNAAALLFKQVWDPVPPLANAQPRLDVPPGLNQLVLEMLAKNPDERPPSASAVRARLLEILRNMPEGREPAHVPGRASDTTGFAAPIVSPAGPVSPRSAGFPRDTPVDLEMVGSPPGADATGEETSTSVEMARRGPVAPFLLGGLGLLVIGAALFALRRGASSGPPAASAESGAPVANAPSHAPAAAVEPDIPLVPAVTAHAPAPEVHTAAATTGAQPVPALAQPAAAREAHVDQPAPRHAHAGTHRAKRAKATEPPRNDFPVVPE